MRALLAVLLLTVAAEPARPEVRHGHFETSDGVRLHYVEAGSGPGIVFVPGWTVPGWVWTPQIEHFSAAYRVVALDPRSQGQSEQATEGHYPERRARDIKELIEHLRIAPALAVGHSLAVVELLSYVDQFGSDKLAGLVLVDQGFGPYPKPEETAQFFAFIGAIGRDRRAFFQQNRSHFFRKPLPEDYVRRLDEDVMKVPTTTALALLTGFLGMDHRPTLAKIDKPILYAITPQYKADGELLKSKVPGARVEVFENSAHALYKDEPERFNRVVGELARTVFAQGSRR
jgi:non-heme chloroperoxidase